MRGFFLASMFVLGSTGGATVVLQLSSDELTPRTAPTAMTKVGDPQLIRVTSRVAPSAAVTAAPVVAGSPRYIRLDPCAAGADCAPITASL